MITAIQQGKTHVDSANSVGTGNVFTDKIATGRKKMSHESHADFFNQLNCVLLFINFPIDPLTIVLQCITLYLLPDKLVILI